METVEQEAMWKGHKVTSFARLRLALQEEELLEASVARVRPQRHGVQKGGKKLLQSSINYLLPPKMALLALLPVLPHATPW